MMETPKRQLWTLTIRPVDVPLIARLNRAAALVDQSASQLVRQAIREKLDRLAAEFPQINEAITQQQASTTN